MILIAGVPALISDGRHLDRTDIRILDATRDLSAVHGTKVTIDQITEASKVSRATVFRRFGTRDALIEQMFQREIRSGIDRIAARTAEADSAVQRAIEMIATTFEVCTSHPVIRHLATNEPDNLIKLGNRGDPSPMTIVRRTFADLIQLAIAERRNQSPQTLSSEAIADTLVHLVAGYTFMPHGHADVVNPTPVRDAVTEIVRRLLG
jgi:AcrR family transcriptional regulator